LEDFSTLQKLTGEPPSSLEYEDKITVMRGWAGQDPRWVGMPKAKARKSQPNMSASTPIFDVFARQPDFDSYTIKSLKPGLGRRDVGPQIKKGSNTSIKQKQTDRNPDIDSRL